MIFFCIFHNKTKHQKVTFLTFFFSFLSTSKEIYTFLNILIIVSKFFSYWIIIITYCFHEPFPQGFFTHIQISTQFNINYIPYIFIYPIWIWLNFKKIQPLNTKKLWDLGEEERTYRSESFAPSQPSPAERPSKSECCLRLCSGSITDYDRKGGVRGKENRRCLTEWVEAHLPIWLIFSCSKRGIWGIWEGAGWAFAEQ